MAIHCIPHTVCYSMGQFGLAWLNMVLPWIFQHYEHFPSYISALPQSRNPIIFDRRSKQVALCGLDRSGECFSRPYVLVHFNMISFPNRYGDSCAVELDVLTNNRIQSSMSRNVITDLSDILEVGLESPKLHLDASNEAIRALGWLLPCTSSTRYCHYFCHKVFILGVPSRWPRIIIITSSCSCSQKTIA